MKLICSLLLLGAVLSSFISPPFSSPQTESLLMSDLVINEFMASNDSTVTDTAGDFDDWIELYNKGNAPIDLTGYYLSDKTDNPLKWQIDTTFVLQADSYLIIWADENGSQGPFHANFKLSAAGENIYLSDSTGMLLDSVSFGPQTTDISMARKPNGTGNFVMSDPTFNASNNVTSREPEIAEEDFLVYPNPAQSLLRIQIDAAELRDELYIYNTMGQLIMTKEINSTELNIETSSWAEGLYIFQYKGLSRRIFVSPL